MARVASSEIKCAKTSFSVTSAWLPTDTRMLKPTPTSYPRLNIVAISAPLWLTTPIGPTGSRSTPIANEAVSKPHARVDEPKAVRAENAHPAGARDFDDAPLARRAFGTNLRHLRRNDHRGAHAGCRAVLDAGKELIRRQGDHRHVDRTGGGQCGLGGKAEQVRPVGIDRNDPALEAVLDQMVKHTPAELS